MSEKIYETYSDGYIKSDVVLSIGILVSNHINYISKCLDRLKPLLDNVNSELVILDTVGPEKSDGSIEICKRYTDKIYRFEWINDFSAARNELLNRSVGEWFMYQDDDEWFDDVAEFINFFNSPERYKYNSGFYFTKDYIYDGSASTGIAGRMIRRRPDTHFEGRVHEHFNEANLPGKQFKCFTHHQGYIYETEEQRMAKTSRNLTILDAEIKEKGLSPERCAQKVQELMNLKDRREEAFNLSVEYSDRFVDLGLTGNRNVQWMIVIQARYFHFLKDGVGSVRQTALIRNKYRLSHFAMLALACTEAEAIVAFTDGTKYLNELENDVLIYKTIHDHFKDHPEEELAESQLDFPKFMVPEKYNAVLTYGAQVKNYLNKYDEALKYWNDIDWQYIENPAYFKSQILYTLQNIISYEPLRNYYKQFMNPLVFEQGNEKYLPKDLRTKMNVVFPSSPDQVTDLADLEVLPLDAFIFEISKIIKSTSNVFEDKFLCDILSYYESLNVPEYDYIIFAMTEEELKRLVSKGVESKIIDVFMIEYINSEHRFYQALYLPSSFKENTIDWLPEECKYNDLLYRFISANKKELSLLIAAAKLRPDMAKVIKYWMNT